METPFIYQRRVEFSDTDMAGIVHFASFFRFMEEAEHAFLRHQGLTVFSLHDRNILTWPRVHVECDFQSPARFEDILAIEVTIASHSSKAVTYGFNIRIGARAIAVGKIVAVCCQMIETDQGHSMKATAIPAAVRIKLGLDPTSPSTEA